jgi:TRAP transporter TAXI family solute receptor
LERLPGVKRAEVSLEKARAEVEFDDSRISPSKVAAAIDRLGFQSSVLSVAAAPKHQAAKIEGPKGSPVFLAADSSPPSRMISFGIETLLARSTPPMAVTTSFTTTDAEALGLLEEGKAQLGFLSLDGVERAVVRKQAPSARFLMGGRILLALHIIVPKASPILSARQLQGKRFGVLDVGGVGERMTRLAVEALGLRYDRGRSLLMGQHVAPLKRGEIAALVAAVPLPSPLVAGLTREMEIRVLPLDEATITAVLQKDRTLRQEVIPKGSYQGQGTDVASVAGMHANALVAHKDLNDASVYQVLEVVLGEPAEMQRACPFAKEFVGENLVPQSRFVPSHPGAERYFQSKKR